MGNNEITDKGKSISKSRVVAEIESTDRGKGKSRKNVARGLVVLHMLLFHQKVYLGVVFTMEFISPTHVL